MIADKIAMLISFRNAKSNEYISRSEYEKQLSFMFHSTHLAFTPRFIQPVSV